MQFFSACYTKEQAKAEYRRLAKIYHPDLGGDEQTMKEINAQFEAFQTHGSQWQALRSEWRTQQPQQQPQAKQKQRQKRKSKIYTVGAIQGAIDRANMQGGSVRYYDGVIVIESAGLKTVVAIPIERGGVTYYTIRQYNVTPKKYAA